MPYILIYIIKYITTKQYNKSPNIFQTFFQMPIKKISGQSKTNNSKVKQNYLHELETPTQRTVSERQVKYEYAKSQKMSIIQCQETMDFDNQAEKMNEVVDKLFAKNKISQKNAFDVPVIDVSTLKSINEQGEGSWSKAANTLGNSTKVYGFRVDFVIQNASKMTASIQRSQNTEQITESKQTVQKQQMNFQSLKNSNLNTNFQKFLQNDRSKLDHLNLQHRQNPFLLQTRRKFDQNNINSLLLNQLSLQKQFFLNLYPKNCQNNHQNDVIECSSNNFSIQLPFHHQINSIPIFQQIKGLRQLVTDHDPYSSVLQQLNASVQILDYDQFRNQLEYNKPQQQYIFNPQIIETDVQFHETHENLLDSLSAHTSQRVKQQILSLPKTKREKVNEKMRTKKQVKKKKERKKIKKAEFQIDFGSNLETCRSSVITADITDLIRKNKGYYQYKDKNLITPELQTTINSVDTKFSSFNVAVSTFRPLPQQQPLKDNLGNYSLIQQVQDLSKFQTGRKKPNMTMHSQFTSTIIQNKAANIKQTKHRLLNLLQESDTHSMKFSNLFDEYRNQVENNSSQAICFLSLLHLCNENGFEIQEGQSLTDFQIYKPN